MEMWTLDDFEVSGKTVFLRIDVNSPLDPETLDILDASRIMQVIPTLQELQIKGAKTVIFAHQGRPGSWDFTPLKNHRAYLEEGVGVPVRYVEDIYGNMAQNAIRALHPSDILLLENVRQYEGEQAKKTAHEHAKSPLVTSLAPLGDLFVNDAFAAAHRSHCSLVGFAPVLPSCAGRLLEKEVRTLTNLVSHPAKPTVFLFGGAKYGNVLAVLEALLGRGIADTVLLAGVPGLVFLEGFSGCTGSHGPRDVSPEDMSRVQGLLQRFKDLIVLPRDFAFDSQGVRQEAAFGEVPAAASLCDIGEETITVFSEKMRGAQTIFFSGPPGVFENKLFQVGTQKLCTAVAESPGFSLIGGGHTVAAFSQFGLLDKISYVSTGGGSLERFIMGESLPVVEALCASKNLYKDSY
jgi:phosphoglycerate kinase